MSNPQLVNQINEQLQRAIKDIGGDSPIEKQILLLKITEALENAPQFGNKPVLELVPLNANGYRKSGPCSQD